MTQHMPHAEGDQAVPEEDLTDLPGPVRAELTRLRAERVAFGEERERMRSELRETEQEARTLAEQRDRLLHERAQHPEDLTERAAQADTLAHDLARVQEERNTLRAELAEVRRDRDRLRMHILDAELPWHEDSENAPDLPLAPGGALHAAQRAAELTKELDAMQQTISWRITAPLRAVRRRSR